VRAPFAGVIEHVPVERGALLNSGDICATVVALSPLRVVTQISERDIGDIKLGMVGHVDFVTGQKADGLVRFIAPAADEATRTFRVELEIDNPDNAIRVGVTAEIKVDLERTRAHRVAQSSLTLNDDGVLGVRAVDAENRVVFHPVEIIGANEAGMWVSGLPETVSLITVGQDFVVDGQTVRPMLKTAEVTQ